VVVQRGTCPLHFGVTAPISVRGIDWSDLTRQDIRGDDLVDRLHRWLAVSSCRLAIVQMEDVAGLARQPNLPGTPDKAPNWRQSLPIMLESLADAPRWRALPQIFRKRHHQG
jgi:4-alpha-glucanotransferase